MNEDGSKGYTWNATTGCTNGVDICAVGRKCYARKFTIRYPEMFPNGFNPTFYPDRLPQPFHVRKPSAIFMGSMGDQYCRDMHGEWIEAIMGVAALNPQHKFLTLTKCSVAMSKIVMPRNVWAGVTVNKICDLNRITNLKDSNARHKFISFEPLYEDVLGYENLDCAALEGIDWVIIGAQTNPKVIPRWEWVENIFQRAFIKNVPVFIKDNLHDNTFTLEWISWTYDDMRVIPYWRKKQVIPWRNP